jgi:N-glycosylase/DNA lyase
MKERPYPGIDRLLADYAARQSAIRQRLDEFSRVPREEFFYELAYCLLTPQSSALNAARAVEELRASGCFHHPGESARILSRRDHYIRFHNTKAKHLAELCTQFPALEKVLERPVPSRELRQWLVSSIRGLGWKEASHFLRNIGHRNLAILDRHILRNLRRHGVIRTIPKALTAQRYLAIERRFARFADEIGVGMDELDLLFWSRETGTILK